MSPWVRRWYRFYRLCNSFILTRFLMNAFIAVLYRVALTPIANILTAMLGPTVRGLAGFGVHASEVGPLLGKVGQVYNGETPEYVAMGALTPAEQQDIAEGMAAVFTALLTEYRITLTVEQVSTLLAAVSDRLTVRFPAPAPAA
jgi:hypothetical protein